MSALLRTPLPLPALRRALASPAAFPRRLATARFRDVPQGPEDAILGITLAFNRDTAPTKLNLGVGAYRDDHGRPFVLPSVRAAERTVVEDELNMEYLPVAGDRGFADHALDMAFGKGGVDHKNVAVVQTLSGTGALRLAGELLSRFAPNHPEKEGGDKQVVMLPKPSWANHKNIFQDSDCVVKSYAYYDPVTKSVDYDACVRDLEAAKPETAVLLHACAHNPTGCDLNQDQWKELSTVFKEKKLLPLFDMAYQGFTSGDTDIDAFALRQFVKDGHKVMLCQSFSKNFGLYGHRVGALSVLTENPEQAKAVESQLKILARPMYSNPPLHGARIINKILSTPELAAQWRQEVKDMAERIKAMRTSLKQELDKVGSKLNWDHVVNQHGMFCFSGLTPEQVKEMAVKHHVYLTMDGRISMAGVSSGNVAYLAKAMHEVTKQ